MMSLPGEWPRLRLLVVDDEVQILELLDLTLSMYGYEVTTARSGPQALEFVEQHPPFDVIVLDVLMTPWDGFETLRQLDLALGERLPPVVFLSGLNRATQVPELSHGAGSAFLVKPFRPSQLVEVIGRVYQERHSGV